MIMMGNILFLVVLLCLGASIIGFSLGFNDWFQQKPWSVILLILKIMGISILLEAIVKMMRHL